LKVALEIELNVQAMQELHAADKSNYVSGNCGVVVARGDQTARQGRVVPDSLQKPIDRGYELKLSKQRATGRIQFGVSSGNANMLSWKFLDSARASD
jgi:hypothetical protein